MVKRHTPEDVEVMVKQAELHSSGNQFVWQYIWLNPENLDTDGLDASLLDWQELKIIEEGDTMEYEILKTLNYRTCDGEPMYKVRAVVL